MIDPKAIILRSLRYHSPTEEIRESFYVKGNNVYCSKPHLLNSYIKTNTVQEPEVSISTHVRKRAKNEGTGRKRVMGYKRKPAKLSLQEQLLQAESPTPFLPKALTAGVKTIYKYWGR